MRANKTIIVSGLALFIAGAALSLTVPALSWTAEALAQTAAEPVKPDAGLLAKIYAVQTQSLLTQAQILAALTKLVDQRPVAVNTGFNTTEQQVCEFGGVPYSIGAVVSGERCVSADEHSTMVHPAGYKPSRPPVWEVD